MNKLEHLNSIRNSMTQKIMDWREEQFMMPMHCAMSYELGYYRGFKYCRDLFKEYEAAANAVPNALGDHIMIAYHKGVRGKSLYNLFQGNIISAINFQPELVELAAVYPRKYTPVILLGYDEKYKVFAEPFKKSLEKNHAGEVVSFLFNAHPLGPKFYHTMRFLAAWDLMQERNCPVWLMDVDAIANRNLEELYKTLDGHDVAFRMRPGRLEPWNQYNASVIGFNNTALGRTYLASIVKYIDDLFTRNKLYWGVDQLAMLCVHEAMPELDIKLLDNKAVDYKYTPEGVIWCNSGKEKWNHLDPTFKDPERQTYLDKFREYQNE